MQVGSNNRFVVVAKWTGPGDILRWWRTAVARVSQRELADRLMVRPSTLSNWESGLRAISIGYQDVDAGLDADGVLASLMWGFGSVEGLSAHQRWSHVFAGESTPVWAWVRGDTHIMSFVAEWGVARVTSQIEMGVNGGFLTVNNSVAESPVIMELRHKGWVEFGRGELPANIPGAHQVDVAERAERSSADGPFMEMFLESISASFGSRSWSREMVAMAWYVPNTIASYLQGRSRLEGNNYPRPLPDHTEGGDDLGRDKFEALRRARGLSLVETSERLSAITGVGVSKDTLRRFESDVGHPHDPILPAALDTVLGAGGHLTQLPFRKMQGSGLVSVPPWWYGPLWIAFDGPGEFRGRIRWGDWYRNIRGRAPLVVHTQSCFPQTPLRVTVDVNTNWIIGLGFRAGTVSIDQNWVPANMAAAQRALAIVEQAFIRAYGLRPGPYGSRRVASGHSA